MKKWVLGFLMPLAMFSTSLELAGQSIEVTEPLDIITNGKKYATEAARDRGGVYTYDYYKSDADGNLKWPKRKQVDLVGWDSVLDFARTDSDIDSVVIDVKPDVIPDVPPMVVDRDIINLMPDYVNSLVVNRVNLTQFKDVEPIDGFSLVFGQGSPYFSDMQTVPQVPLKKGWDYTYTGGLVGADVVPSGKIGAFYNGTGTWAYLAKELRDSDGAKYADLAYVDGTTQYPRLDLVSRNSAMDLGKLMYYYRRGYTNDRLIGSFLWDEEFWNYPAGGHSFVGALLHGFGQQAVNGEQSIIYGNNYSPTNFRKGITEPYPNGQTDEEIEGIVKNFGLNNSDYYNSGAYADFALMYFKTPVPEYESYYKKDGSGYVLDGNGHRIFRTDAFTDVLFGEHTEFHNKPTDDYLKYTKSSYQKDVTNHRSDVYWAIEQQYRHHDMLQIGLKARSYAYGHNGDVTHFYDEGIKPYAVVCLHTEPYTPTGNGHEQREIGKAGVESYLTITGMSGLLGFETWEDGTNGESYVGRADSPFQTNPKQGERLYNRDINFSRFETATATAQAIKAAYNGIPIDEGLRYFSFSKYLDSYRNKELLSQGFYNNGKLGIYLVYPFHDATDVTSVKVTFGDVAHVIELEGRRPFITQFDIQDGLEPSDFRIEYVNIDGERIERHGDIAKR